MINVWTQKKLDSSATSFAFQGFSPAVRMRARSAAVYCATLSGNGRREDQVDSAQCLNRYGHKNLAYR
jgi:hypothetical protein